MAEDDEFEVGADTQIDKIQADKDQEEERKRRRRKMQMRLAKEFVGPIAAANHTSLSEYGVIEKSAKLADEMIRFFDIQY